MRMPIGASLPDALRWLAQLSVNMVDYIDSDDNMTGFQWTTTPQGTDTGWVFGTEVPKLTLNEIFLQYNNDPTDPFPTNGMGIKTASKPYQLNVWTELLNPLPPAGPPLDPNIGGGVDRAAAVLQRQSDPANAASKVNSGERKVSATNNPATNANTHATTTWRTR